MVTRTNKVQITAEDAYIHLTSNTFGKGMNPFLPTIYSSTRYLERIFCDCHTTIVVREEDDHCQWALWKTTLLKNHLTFRGLE